MFKRLLLWHRHRTYRAGRILCRFVAKDVRREIEVIDAARITVGVITARTRTWNLLHVRTGLVSKPDFKAAREVRINDLWKWNGQPWGGPVLDPET
jgi:hypothetical protein